MGVLFAILALGFLGSKIPSDANIAARIEETIRAQLQPERVQVVVKRNSSLSTTIERLEITIVGFDADKLPLGTPASEKQAASASVAKLAASAVATPRRGRQVHIVEAHIRCERFLINALPVQSLDLQGQHLYIPWQAVRTGDFEISAAQQVRGTLLLREQDLTRYLRTMPELPLTEPTLQILPTECRISGNTRTAVKMPIQLAGKLAVRDDAVLYLDHPRLRVSVVPVPSLVANRILRDINPLADLNAEFDFPAPLTITNVTQQNGTLRFDATLRFPTPENK